MNRDELLEQYAKGERNFSGVDLRNPELAGIDLNQHVHGLYNQGIDLRQVSLERIDLSHAILYDARLEGANLSHANLSAAFLRRVNFAGANLVSANFCKADLKYAGFMGANLSNADLTEADLSGDTAFTGANLRDANLEGANLEYAYLDYANLVQTRLTAANLKYARIRDTTLRGSNLTRANLSLAELSYVDFRGSNLAYANLSGALLNGADLMGVDLSTVELTEIKRRGSNLILTTCPTNLNDVKLVEKLRQHSQIGFRSDGDYSFTFFLWEVPGQETITIQNILEWGQYQTKTAYEVHDLSSYFRNPEDTAVYEENLTDTKLYLLSEGQDDVEAGVDIYVIGKTPSGNFAGVSAQPAWT